MDSSNKLFLLDAYALIYRAYYAFIKNPRINSKGFNTSAILGFVNTLEEVLKKENPTHIGVAFDPAGPTFRHEAFEQYKAQREETPEAIRLSVPIIKDIIRAYRIPILEVAGYEADDVIGTLATEAGRQGITTYMMTPDKDYGQLVSDKVFMYRPKHTGGFEVMGVEEVKAKFDIQSPAQVIDMLGLMGDSSDNIPGCPGVGEKTAQKLVSEFGSIENLLEHTDQLKGALKTKVETNKELITFSKFLATMRDMIDSIHNVSDRLHEQSQSSLEISDKMREASTTQSDSMQQLNETVEQLSASVNDIAEHATTLANVVADTREDGSQVENKMKETVEISEKGRTDMNQVNTAMQTINESINSLKAAIDKVGTASSEITNITAVIADIAEETNLLSLNASIEAARAGENGRGFAVVATQIGKLAQTSAESVHTIENLIQQINGYVGACVTQANVSVSNIGESGQLISVALATFDSIFQNIAAANELVESMVTKVSKVDDVATNVAAISEEQAASSQEILATSDTMVSQAQEITRSSTHAAEDSKELSVSAEELSNQVNKFKI